MAAKTEKKTISIFLKLISHIILRNKFSGLQIKILWKIFGLDGFDTFFLHYSIEFWFSPFFVFVLIVIRLIVMS